MYGITVIAVLLTFRKGGLVNFH